MTTIVAVTPVGKGHDEHLEKCRQTISEQVVPDGAEVHHVIVGDGFDSLGSETFPHVVAGTGCVVREHGILLPLSANDAGATPRAIGSAYAFGTLKADMVAFLDADVTWDPHHLKNAIEAASRGAEVITSKRLICQYETGEPMYLDEQDSDGDKFADTNTVVLAGTAVKFGQTFNWPAPYQQHCAESGADRVFWERLCRSFKRTRMCTGAPTVRYNSPWLVHYLPGHQPPKVAKLVDVDENGNRIARNVRPKQLWLKVPDTGAWHKFIEHRGTEIVYDEIPHDAEGLVVFGDRGWEIEDV